MNCRALKALEDPQPKVQKMRVSLRKPIEATGQYVNTPMLDVDISMEVNNDYICNENSRNIAIPISQPTEYIISHPSIFISPPPILSTLSPMTSLSLNSGEDYMDDWNETECDYGIGTALMGGGGYEVTELLYK